MYLRHIISESCNYIIDFSLPNYVLQKREKDTEIQYKIRTCFSSLKQRDQIPTEYSLFILKQICPKNTPLSLSFSLSVIFFPFWQ